MRLRLLLIALVFGAICFALGYLVRHEPATPSTIAPTVRFPDSRPPEIRIDETKVELLPGQVLTLDAGPPPDVSSR